MFPKLLICGLEHTGTTLLSDLFRQLPGVDSGFECGVLLQSSPREFPNLQPFAQNMLEGWGITEEALSHCCETDKFEEFYRRLLSAATVLDADTTAIFDKTPRYLSKLSVVLERCDSPVVVSYKDPRASVCSDFKRAKTDNFDAWYDDYAPQKLRYVETCYNEFAKHADNPQVTTVGLEELAMNSRATMERMFAHAGEAFKLNYAIIDTLRYVNVKNRTVSADIAFEYVGKLSAEAQQRVLNDFGRFDMWIYQ